jgi:methionine synthase I (cobalamin-dependent)
MARTDLLTEVATRRLCCDGAMGTQLLARDLGGNECGMLWNVDRAADVREIQYA